jgi:hypothetical protein
VLIEVLHVRPQDFGLWFIIPVAGNFIGSFVCSRLTRRFPLPTLLGAAPMRRDRRAPDLHAAAGVAHPLAIFGPMVFIHSGTLINRSASPPQSRRSKIAGTASALPGCALSSPRWSASSSCGSSSTARRFSSPRRWRSPEGLSWQAMYC